LASLADDTTMPPHYSPSHCNSTIPNTIRGKTLPNIWEGPSSMESYHSPVNKTQTEANHEFSDNETEANK